MPIGDYTSQQFLALAIETAKKIQWRVDLVSEHGFIANTDNSMLEVNSQVILKMDEDQASIQSEATGHLRASKSFHEKTVTEFNETFARLKHSFTKEQLDEKYEELKPLFASTEEYASFQQETAEGEGGLTGLSLFKPRKGYLATPILVYLNVLIFILMVFSGANFMTPDNDSLLKWGANFRPATLEGEWWRLITNCFEHIGIVHLLMNMYALLYIGVLLEPRLGTLRFLTAYILTGIAASVASLWWHDLTISAGASGAIFGMYGVFLAMLTTNLIDQPTKKALLPSISIFIVYNLMYGMKGGVDNAAHIGGLVSGLVIGYATLPSLKKPEARNWEFGTIGIMTILFLSCSFLVYRTIPNDIGKYDEKMKTFSSNEAMAIEVYKLISTQQKERVLPEVEKGISYWNDNTKLINELEQLNIPTILHERDEKLLEYCRLRMESYKLIYKTISENSEKYTDSLKEYNSQIEATLASLKEK